MAPLQEESGETMSCFTITYHQPAQKIRTAEQPPNVLLNEIHHWFNPDNGILKKLDGIAFDVTTLMCPNMKVGTNNDGQADG